MSILEILDTIAAESSTNAKISLLAQHKDNELLTKVIYNALSPRVKFYVKKIREVRTHTPSLSLDTTIHALKDNLSTRKVTGHAALSLVEQLQHRLSPDDSEVLSRIIGKDLKIGMQAKNIAKAYGRELIEETPYMGAVSYSHKKVVALFEKEGELEAQTKMDGRYCNAIWTPNGLYLESRSGETTHLNDATFAEQLSTIAESNTFTQTNGFVLTGELTIPGMSRYKSNGLINSIVTMAKKIEAGENVDKDVRKFEKENQTTIEDVKKRIVYTIWDFVTIDGYMAGYDPRLYIDRIYDAGTVIMAVERTFDQPLVNLIDSKTVTNLQEAIDYFKELLARGEEGVILKAFNQPWKDGKPTYQVKMKLEMTVDLKIVGFQDGTKGTKNEGKYSAILLESSDGRIKTKAAGLKQSEIDYITQNADSLIHNIAEIKCCGITKVSDADYNALLHPSFVRFRDDKVEADSSTTCFDNEAMMLGLQ